MDLRLGPVTLTQSLSDALIVRTRAGGLLLQASCRFNKARRLLVKAGRSLALRHYARHQPIVQVHRLRLGLAQGCGLSIAGPNEVLLGQPELAAKLVGVPFGKPSALLVEGGSGLGLLVLG